MGEADVRRASALLGLLLVGCTTKNPSNEWVNHYQKDGGTLQQLYEDGAYCQQATRGTSYADMYWSPGGLIGAAVSGKPKEAGSTHAECMARKGYTFTP